MISRTRRALRQQAMVLAAVAVLTAAGCSKTRYLVKVIPGATGRALVVSDLDPRLEGEGMEGVQVQITNDSSAGGRAGLAVLASGVTDADGEVTLTIPTNRAPVGPAMIRSGGDQIYPASNSVYLPRGNDRLLILVRPRRTDD